METDAPTHPLLAPWYRRADRADGLLFGYGDEVVTLSGRATSTLLPRLLPLLDGTRDLDELVDLLGEAARPAVLAALALLRREGLVLAGPAASDDEPARDVANLVAAHAGGASPHEIARAVAAVRVDVRGGGTTAAAVADALAAAGVPVERAPLDGPETGGGLSVVAPRPDELPQLDGWNARALAERTPWLVVLPFDGARAVVGPLVLPGESACFACLRIRRLANLPFPEEYRQLDGAPAAFPVAPPVDALLAGLVTLAVVRWTGAGDPLFVGAAYTLELGADVSLARHVVYPVPRCPACSPLVAASPVSPWYG